MIPEMIPCVHIASCLWSSNDSMCSVSSIGCQEDFHRWRLPMRHGDIGLLVNSCLTIQPMIFTTSSRSFCSHQNVLSEAVFGPTITSYRPIVRKLSLSKKRLKFSSVFQYLSVALLAFPYFVSVFLQFIAVWYFAKKIHIVW